MKCKEAYVCLLSAPRADDLPPELVQHLFRCAKCRQRQRRLLGLDQELRQVPPPVETPGLRQRLLDNLPPQIALPTPAIPAPADGPSWRERAAVLATAATILLTFGLAMGWVLSQRARHTPPLAAVPNAGPTESVVGRILEKHVLLAEASSSAEQLALLNAIAADLRTEAMRLAREGPVEDVLLVSSLYERVVCQGVVGRAKILAPEQQAEVMPVLARQLAQTADESEQAAADALPGAGEGLRNLARAARAASQNLAGEIASLEPRSPSWQPARSGTMRDLLGVLVLQGIELAEETDPLRRAATCNSVAEHLVQGILLASSGGDADRAAKLGGFLGSVMDRGVATNLDRYQPAGPEDARMAEVKQIGEQSVQTVEVLEKNLEKAPPAAQPALQKAIEASSGPLPPKFPDMGKGKKPPRGLPPGLMKTLERGKPIPPNMQKRLPRDLFEPKPPERGERK
jgi:hypothetical protein